MATLRDIKRKIDAVKKTQQITRAMNMVAAAKLRTTQQKLDQFLPYAKQLTEIMNRVAAGVESDDFPLLKPHEEVVKVELISISADRGLCGAFNTNLNAAADKHIAAKEEEGLEEGQSIKKTSIMISTKVRDRLWRLKFRMTYDEFLWELCELYENSHDEGQE